MVIQWLIGNYNPGTYGCFQSHGGTPTTIIHFWMDFPMEISHPAIKAYPHDYGNLHIMIYIYILYKVGPPSFKLVYKP
jgi:hypothetical protein